MALFVALAFAFQIHIDVPLPVPRAAWPIAAAVLLALAALRRPDEPARAPAAILVVPLVGLLAVPAVLVATAPPLATSPQDLAAYRLLSWNMHTAVNGDGQVDLETIAALIESEDPDVVVLQEVGRGWPIAGSMDQAEWLSLRLDMPFSWAPAADDQFGNVVLSRFPIEAVEVRELPYGEGPQHRSALRAVLQMSPDTTVTVIDAHLQNGDKPETREAQIAAVLDLWGGDLRTVIAGDLNMQPTEDNVNLFLDAGLVSAQDTAGDPSASTARDPTSPTDRVDWIWGTPDLTFEEFEIPASEASDHLPLVTDVSLPL